MLALCISELDCIDMVINVTKSACLRVNKRFNGVVKEVAFGGTPIDFVLSVLDITSIINFFQAEEFKYFIFYAIVRCYYSQIMVQQILQDRSIDDEEGEGEFQVDFYDRHHNPSYRQVQYLFDTWKKEHCGFDDASMITALQARAEELALKGMFKI
jgi:hypothetical protein